MYCNSGLCLTIGGLWRVAKGDVLEEHMNLYGTLFTGECKFHPCKGTSTHPTLIRPCISNCSQAAEVEFKH